VSEECKGIRRPDDPSFALCVLRSSQARAERDVSSVTTIYLEPNLLALETADEAATQLRYLADWGAELVLVSDGPLPEWDDLGVPTLRCEATPDGGRRGDWWLTADPADCSRRPGRGVTSVLIGGAVGAGAGPTARCDLGARDLRGAVLEILSRQAMPDRRGTVAAR
jgi:hypothetical protein